MKLTKRVDLIVPYTQKDEAKSLGARWDPIQRTWYAPAGSDASVFQAWCVPPEATHPADDTPPPTLSQLLYAVQRTLQKHNQLTWVQAEVSEWASRRGTIYLVLTELDAKETMIAQARGIIWSQHAPRIVEQLTRLTGSTPQPGMKLLLHARIHFHLQHGLSLVIENIDPNFTLGAFEIKIKRIREQLIKEGIHQKNKALNTPQDFTKIAVISAKDGAGLGDFQREAHRLSLNGLCQFDYFDALLQGKEAPQSIINQLKKTLSTAYDAVMIVRGGGAQVDLHSLSDLDLSRQICLHPVPVITGIGHQRDFTLIDEVANCHFDTPSKVIQYVQESIFHNAQAAWNYSQEIDALITYTLHKTTEKKTMLWVQIEQLAQTTVNQSQRLAENQWHLIQQSSHTLLSKHEQHLHSTYHAIQCTLQLQTRHTRQQLDALMHTIAQLISFCETHAEKMIEDMMKNILGFSPNNTLKRGFTLTQSRSGKTITCRQEAQKHSKLTLTFHDGTLNVLTEVRPEDEK